LASPEEIRNFSKFIEEIAEAKRMSLFDSVLYYCSETKLEEEIAAELISPALKAKIEKEVEELNLIKKKYRLPI
jgi:hypothetical protein